MGNTAKQCRLGLFQDSDFAGDLEDSKSTSGGTLCIFGSHTFVPISWMCKKQTSVSHGSAESEIISLDIGLRLDGLLALEFWELIVSVLGNVTHVSDGSAKPDSEDHKHHKSHKKIDVMERHWCCSFKCPIRASRSFIVCVWGQWSLWSRWSLKAEVLQWDMFPELTELLLIGCSIESIWTPRSISNTSTPKTNSQTS